MSCAACAGKIERKLSCVPGVDWVSVNFANKKALVRGTATLESLCEAIELSGYKANLQQAKSPERDHAQLKTQKMSASLALALSAPVVFLSMAHIDSRWSQWLQLLFTLPVLFLGRNFFIRAFKSVKNRSATMDTLVALGTGTAFLFSVFQMLGHKNQLYFESASVVIALVLVGRTLEEIAKNRSQSALFDLMTVAPQTVIRISKTANLSSSTQIPLSELKKGDYFLVRPGEVVATDGLVVEGISSVEES
ncbi:MAG: cation-translocating P-type ATPase, partial [Proteobacteria bacterium]|nr:cation-translocating P-type ATPase [Pseudomonadota bacterium]